MENIVKISRFRAIFNSRIAHHIYFWGFLAILMIIEDPTSREHYIYGLLFILQGLPPVYLHFYVFEKYFYKKKFLIYTVSVIIIIAIFGYLSYWIMINYMMGPDAEKQPGMMANYLTIILLMFITTALKLTKRSIRQEFQLQEIRSKQTKTELDLLKSQINPHFLFNTLNNLFSMARKDKDSKTADGIAKLAHILRYMLYESNVDETGLDKEIEQINSFIELQKLRFSEDDDIKIDFWIDGPVETVKIPPMLLMPFVENAFKHSISLHAATSVEFHIKISERKLTFSAKNTINRSRQETDNDLPGIGLTNIKRRLELLYPDNHELVISDDGEYYNVKLIIRF
ncbi:MAG: hypothetical protein GY863_11640 [bacterium]|nr:hypothetical protein [bacterium]